MKPDHLSDEELEQEFLEQSLHESAKEKSMKDLSILVRQRFEQENDQGKGDDMSTIAAAPFFAIESTDSTRMHRFWQRLANVASIGAIALLIATLWDRGFFSPEQDDPSHGVGVVQDEDEVIEDHEETPPTVVITSALDVEKMPSNTRRIRGQGQGITDDVLLAIIAHQPNLEQLELYQTWITDRGARELSQLTKLRVLSLASNAHIGREGWLSLQNLTNIEDLDVSVFVGQTAAFSDGLNRKSPRPPAAGVPAGKFMVPLMSNLAKLKSLDLSGTDIDDQALNQLARTVGPRLVGLDLSHTKVTAAGIHTLSSWANLRRLTAIDVAKSSKSPLMPFADLSQLSSLTVGANGMSSLTCSTKSLVALAQMPHLQHLGLTSISFGEGQLSAFADATRNSTEKIDPLYKVELRHCFGLTDKDCQSLASIRGIEHLSLVAQRELTEAGFLALTEGNPKHLDIRASFPKLRAQTIESALKKRPDLSIRLWNAQVKKLKLTHLVVGQISPSDAILQNRTK